MINKKIRIGIVGLGDIAQKAYLPIITNHPSLLPIFCTRNSKILSQLADRYRIKDTCKTLDELLLKKPDAVMVHSNTASHYLIVKKVLEQGLPVFVDKPLSASFQECEALLNLASQKRLLLYVGFNRRFAPLISNLKKQKNPYQILWQKNRVNLPGRPRVFIYDDFIHVLDSLLFLSQGTIENLQVFSNGQNGQLESIQVNWQDQNTLLSGLMNRVSGLTEERVELFTKGNKWLIKELHSGTHSQQGHQKSIGFGNWENTLYKRGFTDMIDDWIRAVQNDSFDATRIQDIWETHQLCERVLLKVLDSNQALT